jgi:hypothetical protein
VRQTELSRPRAFTARLTNLPAADCELKDAVVAVTFGDEDPAFRRKRNIGGSVEGAARRFGRSPTSICSSFSPFGLNLMTVELSRVDRPDIALGVEPDRVRNLVQSFAKRVQDAAFPINRYDWIGFVAALNEPRHTGVRVARHPRNHPQFLALGQLNHEVGLFERQLRRRLNQGAQSVSGPYFRFDLSPSQGRRALSEKR